MRPILVAALAAQVLDFVTFAIAMPLVAGFAYEANGIISSLYSAGGPVAVGAYKAMGTAFIATLLTTAGRYRLAGESVFLLAGLLGTAGNCLALVAL